MRKRHTRQEKENGNKQKEIILEETERDVVAVEEEVFGAGGEADRMGEEGGGEARLRA